MRMKVPRNAHISDKTSSALVKAGKGQAALPQLCAGCLRPPRSPLTEDAMPISPDTHPWIPGRSNIHIPSVTHRIGTSQTFVDNKKDKNHIAWGSAKLLFHPIRVLNC